MVHGLCFVGCAAITVVLLVAFTWFCLVAVLLCLVAVLLSLLYFQLLSYFGAGCFHYVARLCCWLLSLCGQAVLLVAFTV